MVCALWTVVMFLSGTALADRKLSIQASTSVTPLLQARATIRASERHIRALRLEVMALSAR
jgi:hypothetical protein